MVYKVTFNQNYMQFLLRLAHEDHIDLPLWVFVRIEANVIFTKILPYEMIITRLLLQRVVAPQAEEYLVEQMSQLDMTLHRQSLG